MEKFIELTISPKGETTLVTKGFAGAACQEASRFLEAALGEAVTERKTAEFYAPAAAEQTQHVQQ